MKESLFERIPNLCAALREAGLGVSVRDEVAVRDVLLALAASAESPKSAEDLRDILRPVLCRSQDQLRTYDDIFAEIFPQTLVPVEPGPRPPKPKSRRWGRAAIILLGLLLLAGGGYWAWNEFWPTPTPDAPKTPTPKSPIPSEPAPNLEVVVPGANKSADPATEEKPAPAWPAWLPYALGSAGGLVALLTFIALRSRQTSRYLNRRLLDAVEDVEDDVIFQVPIRSPFPEGLIRACALELRKHRDIDLLDHLDVPATVRASVRRGGWFTPVGRRFKRTPEYLILIQQLSGADHRGRLARYLAAQLRAEGVPVNVWTFRHEPDVLYPENDDGTADALTLEQLHVRMPDHRLLIFSERSAGSGGSAHLALWEQGGAWFADRHPDPASLPGTLMAAPAGAAGLEAYTAVLRGERASLRAVAPGRGLREELPVLLTADRERWTDVRPPSSGTIAAGLQVLEEYLGAGGMFWLRACAAYPELDWNLTVALGRELDDRIAKSARPDLLNRLIALPWFQEGAMPQWLRRALLRPLHGPERKAIHRALNRILVEGAAEVTGDPAVRNEVHQLIAKNPSLIDRLARKLKRREPAAGWRERTVVETFGGEGAVRIPVPGPERGPVLVPRWAVAVLALAFLAAGTIRLLQPDPSDLADLPDSLPITEAQAREATRWIMTNFGGELLAGTEGTPFPPEVICGMICQETAYFWLPLLKNLSKKPEFSDDPVKLRDTILARCILDASGDFPGTQRSAFPSNTAAFRARYGDEFTKLLIDEANQTRALRGYGSKTWVYKGYGIFQYDLQHVTQDEAFFRERQWYQFGPCLNRSLAQFKGYSVQQGTDSDLWETIRAYGGSGPMAIKYRDNVKIFTQWAAEEIEAMRRAGTLPKPATAPIQNTQSANPEAKANTTAVPAPTPMPELPNPSTLPLPQPITNNQEQITASRAKPFTNTLGMKFVPVPVDGQFVLFCIWETRVQDYAAFAKENPKIDMEWKDYEYKGNKQGPDHPVVNVSWEDAQAFCRWLSAKEGRPYRLPTDREWSVAVGLETEPTGGTPEEKDAKIADVYPWGTGFPPPTGAGNYAGRESKFFGSGWSVMDGYTDKHLFTAPAGSYTANKYGIYDLGGNVWEWCEDYYDGKSGSRVLRGASWRNIDSTNLLSSYRLGNTATSRNYLLGFRCVVGVGSGER